MTRSNLDRMMEEMKALKPDELRRLREALDDSLTSGQLRDRLKELERKREEIVEEREHLGAERKRYEDSLREEKFERQLLSKGIISEIPPRIIDPLLELNRRPVEIEGTPVSEIIIEERR